MNQHTFAGAGSPLVVDPTSLLDDPHAAFAALRADHPVIQTGPGQYIVLRAADVVAMLTDPRTVQIEGADYVAHQKIPAESAVGRLLRDIFLFSNGDDHRAKRGMFARAFAHREMRAARDRIRAVADEMVAALPHGETFDFVETMAARLPAEMIATILGLPKSDTKYFASLVYSLSRCVTPIYPMDAHDEIEAAAAELYAYVEQHLQARQRIPRGDLLSTLVADWQASRAISFESLVHQVMVIIIGGTDTTRAAFAMLVSLLLQRPDDWAAVKADPAMIPGAVAEGLRYDPSVGSIIRIAVEPVEIGGVQLPAGAYLRCSTMSAMRDPELYAEPETFDIRRVDHPRLHPVLGAGPHRCIGEMLAKIEMQEALAALAAGAPTIELITPPELIGYGGIRQITPMEVRIG